MTTESLHIESVHPRVSAGSYSRWTAIDNGESAEWMAIVNGSYPFPDGYEMGLHQTNRTVPFSSWEAMAEWAEENFGVTGWARVKSVWVPKNGSDARPCGVPTANTQLRFSTYSRCENPRKKGEDLCGVHLAHARKEAEKLQARRAHQERSNAGSAIASDAVEALKARDIKAWEYYRIPFGPGEGEYTGEVMIHAEDMLALLRKLDRAEEILGEELS